MPRAKVFYNTRDSKKPIANVTGEVIELGDRWITIVPDDESIRSILIPAIHIVTVEYEPYPEEQEQCPTNKS